MTSTPSRFRLATLATLLLVGAPALAQDIPDARVVLPWSDFKTLYERGQAPKDPEQVPPHAWVLSNAKYVGNVEGEATIFRATMKIDVLEEKGWVRAPLLPSSVALRQARINGKDAPIALYNGWYNLVTKGKGPLTIELEFAVTTYDSSGISGFAFELPRSGGTEVDLSVDSVDLLEFKVAGAQQIVTSEAKGRRQMHALLPPNGNLSVSWERSSKEATADPAAVPVARVYAEQQALIGVGEGILQGTSIINYSILFAGMDRFEVDLPGDVTVLDVTAQGLRDWSVRDEGGRKVVTAELNFEAKGAWTMRLSYEQPLAEGAKTINTPDLNVRGAERVKGYVGIDARSNLEIKGGAAQVARVIDVRELPAEILGQTDFPVLLGYRYGKQGWSIPLQISQHTDVDMLVTIIDQAAATTVLTPDGRRMTQVTYAMRNNRAQYLTLDLPDGATPWSTFVGGKAVKPAKGDDGRLLVPLARSQAAGGDLARFAVEIVYVEDGVAPVGNKGSFAARLPAADVPTTAVAWTIYVPDEANVKERSIEGTLRQVQWFTPIELGGVSSAEAVAQVQAQANAQFDSEAMSGGVQPVRVTLPLDGVPLYFEKLLAMGDDLSVGFDYKIKD